MTEKEAIRVRHSVRNYKNQKIDADTVREIQKKVDEINETSGLHLQFLEDAGNT